METNEFLRNCTLKEFDSYIKDIAIDDSYNNIEDGTSFKTIIINDGNYEGEVSYFVISDRLSIKDLYDDFKAYALLEDQVLFKFRESTRVFIYSNDEHLIKCSDKDIRSMQDLYKQLKDDDEY